MAVVILALGVAFWAGLAYLGISRGLRAGGVASLLPPVRQLARLPSSALCAVSVLCAILATVFAVQAALRVLSFAGVLGPNVALAVLCAIVAGTSFALARGRSTEPPAR